jgi:hypothetical protein
MKIFEASFNLQRDVTENKRSKTDLTTERVRQEFRKVISEILPSRKT